MWCVGSGEGRGVMGVRGAGRLRWGWLCGLEWEVAVEGVVGVDPVGHLYSELQILIDFFSFWNPITDFGNFGAPGAPRAPEAPKVPWGFRGLSEPRCLRGPSLRSD